MDTDISTRDPVAVRLNILALVMQGRVELDGSELVPLLGRLEAWVSGVSAPVSPDPAPPP